MQTLAYTLTRFKDFVNRRSVAACMLFMVLAFMANTVTSLNTVRINDGDTVVTLLTAGQDPHDLLEKNGIRTLSTDLIHFSGFEDGYGEINITRSFPVTITADKQSYVFYATGGTVEDLLAQLKISYDEDDILTPDPEKVLKENDEIVLKRVEYVTSTETKVLPYETITIPTPFLEEGSVRTAKYGMNGKHTATYERRYVDGVLEEETIIGEPEIVEPVTAKILVGADARVSPMDFSVETDENGIPLNYSKVLKNQVATGYNMPWKYVRGASDMRMSAGYVAVRADEIPYGTKMYITAADGSWTYGYAIAADTGTALMDNIIDVDLYYDTYLESCLNGRQIVDIYILD